MFELKNKANVIGFLFEVHFFELSVDFLNSCFALVWCAGPLGVWKLSSSSFCALCARDCWRGLKKAVVVV